MNSRTSLPKILALACLASLVLSNSSLMGQTSDTVQHWHQIRGPLSTGEAPQGKPPTSWSETENVKWKVAIPGVGSSTPIIWEDRLFLLTAIKTDRVDPSKPAPEDQEERPFNIVFPNHFYSFDVICLNRITGEVLWQETANEAVPNEGVHPDNDFASASPTTDGKRLYVPFGSQGYYCYSLDGELLWSRDLGPVETRLSFGEGASLTVHDDMLVVVRDQEGQSRVLVLDAENGETLWEQDRDEPTCWATPLIVEHSGRTQVVTNGSNRVRSYDLATGELVWECGGQVANVTPSSVRFGDLVISMSGYRGSAAVAVRVDAEGDVTDSDSVAWKLRRGTPYISSPLLYRGQLYFCQSVDGILSRVDAESGNVLAGPTRSDILGRIYASPVAANGHVYFVDREGTCAVFDAEKTDLEPIEINRINEKVDASPAIVGDTLYLRGDKSLYCIQQ